MSTVHHPTGRERRNVCDGADDGRISRDWHDVTCPGCLQILFDDALRKKRPLVAKWLLLKLKGVV